MLNTPNMLSIFRLCLVPVFVVVHFSGLEGSRILSASVYALAIFTDYLDGHIARKYNLITNLGKVLDPLGDKMFTFSVLCCLVIDGIISFWLVLVFLVKELLMGIGGLVIHRVARAEIPPSNIIGKTATVVFFVFCVVIMVVESLPWQAAMAMVGFALLLSCLSLFSYLAKYISIMRARKKS